MPTISISIDTIRLTADLQDTPTAQKILDALPIEGEVQRWGDEIYFRIPLSLELEPDSRAEVEVGELGYWPTGKALCIFFGPTTMSCDDKPVAASAVNVFGHIVSDCSVLRSVPAGAHVSVDR